MNISSSSSLPTKSRDQLFVTKSGRICKESNDKKIKSGHSTSEAAEVVLVIDVEERVLHLFQFALDALPWNFGLSVTLKTCSIFEKRFLTPFSNLKDLQHF